MRLPSHVPLPLCTCTARLHPQSSITRDEFEDLAADFFSRAAAPLKRIIERNGLKPEDLDAVELIGGGSRVPRLQAALSEVLGGRGLDRWGNRKYQLKLTLGGGAWGSDSNPKRVSCRPSVKGGGGRQWEAMGSDGGGLHLCVIY